MPPNETYRRVFVLGRPASCGLVSHVPIERHGGAVTVLTRYTYTDAHVLMKRITIFNPTAPPVSNETKQLMSTRRRALRDGDTDLHRDANCRVMASVRRASHDSIRDKIREQRASSMRRSIRPVITGSPPAQCCHRSDWRHKL